MHGIKFFLKQDSRCVKALIAKAEALYNTCDFEHALVLFTRTKFLSPDSCVAENGILKCKKTILNKIEDEDLFFFSGSKHFFDHLRKEGKGSTNAFLTGKEKSFRGHVSLTGIMHRSIKEKKVKPVPKKTTKKTDRMKADKLFLKSLDKSLKPLACFTVDSVR